MTTQCDDLGYYQFGLGMSSQRQLWQCEKFGKRTKNWSQYSPFYAMRPHNRSYSSDPERAVPLFRCVTTFDLTEENARWGLWKHDLSKLQTASIFNNRLANEKMLGDGIKWKYGNGKWGRWTPCPQSTRYCAWRLCWLHSHWLTVDPVHMYLLFFVEGNVTFLVCSFATTRTESIVKLSHLGMMVFCP